MGMAPYSNSSQSERIAEKFASLLKFENGAWKYAKQSIRIEIDDYIIYEEMITYAIEWVGNVVPVDFARIFGEQFNLSKDKLDN